MTLNEITDQLAVHVSKFLDKRVLVLGDAILDEYLLGDETGRDPVRRGGGIIHIVNRIPCLSTSALSTRCSQPALPPHADPDWFFIKMDRPSSTLLPREIAWDCRFFLGDRPCVWHKRTGVLCTCDHYEQIEERLLIIKLDAMGDVLRSTALLPPLAEAHPRAAITWITRKESVPLLQRNPYVTEVLELGPEALVHLQTRAFNRVINLDASKTSAALATAARSSCKDGFVLDERGYVQPTNDAARGWLESGLFDDIKRQGTATYQERMADILGLDRRKHHYVFELGIDERERAKAHMESLGLDVRHPIIGLNTGAGSRWPLNGGKMDMSSSSAGLAVKKTCNSCSLADRQRRNATSD